MGDIADQLKAMTDDVPAVAIRFGWRAINRFAWVSEGHTLGWMEPNSICIHRHNMRIQGDRIVERVTMENFEYMKARDLTKAVHDTDGFGAVQFRVGRNPKRITHLEVHLQPDGGYLVKSSRFRKVPRVFEWIFDAEGERSIPATLPSLTHTEDEQYADAFASAFHALTGFDMGGIQPYTFTLEDPTMTCVGCQALFGPRAPAHKVRGLEAVFCSYECAERAQR
jgi:hypothetical protein